MVEKHKCPVAGCEKSNFKTKSAMLGHVRFSVDSAHMRYKQSHPEKKKENDEILPKAEVVDIKTLFSSEGDNDNVVTFLEKSLSGLQKAISSGQLKGNRLTFAQDIDEKISSALKNHRIISSTEINNYKVTGFNEGANSRLNEINNLISQIQGRDQVVNNLSFTLQERDKIIVDLNNALRDLSNKAGGLYQDNVKIQMVNVELMKHSAEMQTNRRVKADNDKTREELLEAIEVVGATQNKTEDLLAEADSYFNLNRTILQEIRKEKEALNWKHQDNQDHDLHKEKPQGQVSEFNKQVQFRIKPIYSKTTLIDTLK